MTRDGSNWPIDYQAVYSRRRYLLSIAELRLATSLVEVMPEGLTLMCKVRLADIVSCRFENRISLRRISQKHVDFVLVKQHSSAIVAVIELDDRSHEKESRRRRDEFVNELLEAVGIRLVRIGIRKSYDPSELRAMLESLCGFRRVNRPLGDRPRRRG